MKVDTGCKTMEMTQWNKFAPSAWNNSETQEQQEQTKKIDREEARNKKQVGTAIASYVLESPRR